IVKLPGGLEVNTEEIFFNPLSAIENPAIFGIRVYLKDHYALNNDELKNIVLEVVQQMAGEKRFALDIDLIETAAMPETFDEEQPMPIVELSDYIEDYKTQ